MKTKDGAVVIDSDDAALELLELLESHQLDADSTRIKLDNWPRIEVVLKGEKFNNSLTPAVMEGFIALQKSINRSYALARYGDSSKRLTAEEREALEITVSVEEGSSIAGVDFQQAFENMGLEFAKNMTSEHSMYTLIATGLLVAGHLTLKIYLEHRREIRRSELEGQKSAENKEVRIQELDQMKFASDAEVQRMEILRDIIGSRPSLAPLEDIAEDANNEMLKRFVNADEIEFQGVSLKSGVVEELKTNARRRSDEVNITGNFVVEGSNTRNRDALRVNLKRVGTDEHYTAYVPSGDDRVSVQIRDAISEAEWSGQVLECALLARVSRDKVVRADVASAKIAAA